MVLSRTLPERPLLAYRKQHLFACLAAFACFGGFCLLWRLLLALAAFACFGGFCLCLLWRLCVGSPLASHGCWGYGPDGTCFQISPI